MYCVALVPSAIILEIIRNKSDRSENIFQIRSVISKILLADRRLLLFLVFPIVIRVGRFSKDRKFHF